MISLLKMYFVPTLSKLDYFIIGLIIGLFIGVYVGRKLLYITWKIKTK